MGLAPGPEVVDVPDPDAFLFPSPPLLDSLSLSSHPSFQHPFLLHLFSDIFITAIVFPRAFPPMRELGRSP